MAEPDYVITLNVVSWVLTSIVIVLVTARIVGRTLVTRQTGWDDFFIILGALSALTCSALVTVGVSYGLGRHQADIKDPNDLSEAIKYTIIAPALSIISSTSSKISILIFLVRLMGMSAKNWHLWLLWGLCLALIALNVLAIVLVVGYCNPPQKQWQPWLPGTCFQPEFQRWVGFIQSGYNALMDIIVAVFPALFITKLNIQRRMKVGLSLLMGGSVFAAGATIVKIYLLKDLDKHSDITWYWAPISLWYTAEMDVIIIAGTIPTLWPLVRLMRRRTNRSDDPDVYNMVHSMSSGPEDSESCRPPIGSATRALREIDNMRTHGTWNGEEVRLKKTTGTTQSTL
ncbi:hypothetical protein F4777DRAFT_581278 [Nemania sp. FL0916]|nr:hypothetical protein F4777DRAFT_581278 [Nemania sp. FL0916]